MERLNVKAPALATNAATLPTMETALADLRRTSLFSQLVPMEAGIGWPIPLRREGRVYVTLPLYGFGRADGERRILLFAPFAAVTVDWATRRPVKYVNFAFERPWNERTRESIGVFPHDAIAELSTAEYKERRSRLLGMFDEMLASLQSGAPLAHEWDTGFSTLLGEMIEPALLPYYRALGEKFFDHFLPAQPA